MLWNFKLKLYAVIQKSNKSLNKIFNNMFFLINLLFFQQLGTM